MHKTAWMDVSNVKEEMYEHYPELSTCAYCNWHSVLILLAGPNKLRVCSQKRHVIEGWLTLLTAATLSTQQILGEMLRDLA